MKDLTGAVVLFACFAATSCGAAPQKSSNESQPVDGDAVVSAAENDIATKSEFEAKGLKWPLSVTAGTLGCTNQARWIEIDDVQYGLNGTASVERGYSEIDPIWLTDEKMAADLKAAGIPNDPPLKVNIGDMIAEAGKLC